MNSKFEKLNKLGAGEFEHLKGSLIEHLNGTYQLLKKFESQVVPLSQRTNIAKIIGSSAEEIVYLYCSCDRSFFYEEFDYHHPISFRDRFTNKEFKLTQKQAQQFCELTVANEIELAISSNDFLIEHGQSLFETFIKMEPLLSKPANKSINNVLGKVD